jgi:hypothetical protein
MYTSNLYINLWLFCCFLKEGFYGQRTVTYTWKDFMGLFVLRGKTDTNTGRVSGDRRKGSAAIEQLGFGNDLCLVSYHFPKPDIFRATFPAAHWHRLLRTAWVNILFSIKLTMKEQSLLEGLTCLAWNRKVHYRAHNSLSLISTPGKVNCLLYYFLRVWCTNYYWF